MNQWARWAFGVALVAFATPAWADVSAQGGDIGSAAEGLRTSVCVGKACVNVSGFGTGVHIKGFKFVNTVAAQGCAIYDATSLSSGTGGTNLIDEIYEATAGETNLHIWTSPIRLSNGLTIEQHQAPGNVCIVYY